MDAFEMSLLADYYGAMLTDKQREYLNMRYDQDMSLSEIAEWMSVSRQAVFDNLTRTENLLRRMEENIGCVRRDRAVTKACQTVTELGQQLAGHPDPQVAALAARILAAVQELDQ